MAKPSGCRVGRQGGSSDPRVRETPETAFQSGTQDSQNAREGGSTERQRASAVALLGPTDDGRSESHFIPENFMTKQKSPHTQTEQDAAPERDDLQDVPSETEAAEDRLYERMEGAETGENRSPRKFPATRALRRRTEPEAEAHEGSLSSRTLKLPGQGITAHSSEEESDRQQKVVKDRPDAQAGLNQSWQTRKPA